jgi:transglutaminase-like putative cysteine protease
MRLNVQHRTHYQYDQPVFLDPHVLRLKPPTNATQRLIKLDIAIDPEPAGRAENTDLGGNETVTAWFSGLTDHLTITTNATVETMRSNAFEFLWEGPHELPLAYPETWLSMLGPYREAGFLDATVLALVIAITEMANGDAQVLPGVLTDHLYKTIGKVVRDVGEPLVPAETLRRGEASCRDLTVLYLAVARACGFAGRFVSGYYAPRDVEEYELHAWPELYIPGGGWRGFDPTAGLAVADRHIALAYAPSAELAMPVSGTYRGDARSVMDTDVTISY